MKNPHPLIHPILIFIISLVALCFSLFLYIHWYIKVTDKIEGFATKFHLDKNLVANPQSFMIILVISCLVAIIIVGMAIIFTYYQKSIQLYRLQENFINNFTHELKTPLASIKLYLETFLKYDLDPADRKRFVDYMLKDMERLSGHVNQILQLASIENKNVNYALEDLDIEQVIKNFLEQNAHLFQKGEVSVALLSDGPILHPLNLTLFDILLMNLIGNAYKYNSSPKPKVHIEIFKKATNVYITFQDNGVGLEQKNFKNIFKKFFQVGRADIRTAQGSGLGLYLAQQIVRFHKGKIWAESAGLEKGSKFVVALSILKKPYPRNMKFFSSKEDS